MIEILSSSIDLKSSNFSANEQSCRQALNTFLERKDIGFSHVPKREQLWKQAAELGGSLNKKFNTMVVVGIGGSSLGVRALYEVLGSKDKNKNILFCDNVDPLEFAKLWDSISDIEKTCWVFVSKSGSTIETLVAADFIRQKIGKKLNAVVISEKVANPLTRWAEENQYTCLEIPVDVGGRFSVLTPVGMLPMAFVGFDIFGFRKGASLALQSNDLIAKMMAVITESFRQECWISFFWFYNSAYSSFGRWIQQLWAESLAKKVNRNSQGAPRVSTPMWGLGSCDQHSLLQQLMEGHKDKLIIFNRFEDLEMNRELLKQSQFSNQKFFEGYSMGQLIAAQAQGTCEALNIEKAPTLSLRIKDSSPSCLGFQFMFWQLVVAGLGESLNIDAFNQPGVELGKRLARDILES